MKETLEEWIDEIEEDPCPNSEKKALRIKLLLWLFGEKKTRWFELPKGGRVEPSVRRFNPSQRGTVLKYIISHQVLRSRSITERT